jgi:hypothetical protein
MLTLWREQQPVSMIGWRTRMGQGVDLTMMVALHLGKKKHFVEFDTVPLASANDFRCLPEGVLEFDSAAEIARELAAGYLSGVVAGYRWYRQAGCGRLSTAPQSVEAACG